MKELGVWEPLEVKVQTIKTSIESATMLLRIDDIVSGLQKKKQGGGGMQQSAMDDGGNVDSEQQLQE
jgi:T-complex protein 1 subunit gamma